MVWDILIGGRVQGVGFRPFVHQLATQMKVNGFVENNAFGVHIQAEGTIETLEAFYENIPLQKPQNAIILSIQKQVLSVADSCKKFTIKKSSSSSAVDLPLTPDFAICPTCRREMLDKNSRRYFYPFTTCTQCGPRYAITRKFPFDRKNTSIAAWKMCPDCKKEYKDEQDRRHHSQTNTCPNCGIKTSVTNALGDEIEGSYEEQFRFLAAKLSEGKIVAVKNTSGYLLLCDATNEAAVFELRKRKCRPMKPLAVLFPDIDQLGHHLLVQKKEETILRSSQAPIVVLPVLHADGLAQKAIAPGMRTIGAMLPYSGILLLLSHCFGKPLIATSGNLHGSPICATKEDAVCRLGKIADYFLHHDLPVVHVQDDSVVRFTPKFQRRIWYRRGRGLAPDSPMFSSRKDDSPKVLALGCDLKSTISVVPNRHAYTSEYLGDLADYDNFLRYSKTVSAYQTLFDFKPELILCDRHPAFESRGVLAQFDVPTIAIQHHEAHFAAILGEKKLWEEKEKILGVVWDGTGYASDTEIWGGEFFVYHNHAIKHLEGMESYPWILGDKMAKSPMLSAITLCGRSDDVAPSHFTDRDWDMYHSLLEKSSLRTTSIGRLFDAVAFVLGFRQANSFEGEAAMYLEKLASCYGNFCQNNERIDYLEDDSDCQQVPIRLLFHRILGEIAARKEATAIAFNFHYTMVKIIEKIALSQQCRQIAFSGGVFQNALLVDLLQEYVGKNHLLYFHEMQSPNDENISFGQLQHWLHVKRDKRKNRKSYEVLK